MARYAGPVCRLCRREGMKLFLKGERCYGEKCAIERRNVPPGEHGKGRRARLLGYGLQLREKQKVKRMYGVLERQFRRYFEAADRKKGVTGDMLLQLLERRLDNVVYRLGFATSRPQARQLVRHGHFTVNGRRADVPSFSVRAGDTVEVRTSSAKNATIVYAMEEEADTHGIALGQRLIDGKVEDRSVMDMRAGDQRATPRFRVYFRTTFSNSTKVEGTGLLLDLSMGGCRIESQVTVEPGLSLELRIYVTDLEWPLLIEAASVQWVSDQIFGLAFVRLTGAARQRLGQAIRDLDGWLDRGYRDTGDRHTA